MQKKETEAETFYPKTRLEWREWLEENHASKQSVWLLQYKQKANKPGISWSEAVDEALCFGWIDSVRKSIGGEQFIQFFTRRKPGSVWSKINKGKVDQLIKNGMMSEAGYRSIEIAKQNGGWTILDDVEELIIPPDLELAFDSNPGSKDYYLSLSKSVKKMILQWLVLARRPNTRENRIKEIAELAAQKLRPKQFR
ncbi:MAG: YdeI/OmpD-associated family protein [Sphingobacteriaceae bacterium]|nr:YdeI/OmpD-associated family protein [Sphingobacteriaceae bacterium]